MYGTSTYATTEYGGLHFEFGTNYAKALTESVVLTPTSVRSTNRSLVEVLSVLGGVASVVGRIFTEAIVLIGGTTRYMGIIIYEIISFGEKLFVTLAASRMFHETIGLVGLAGKYIVRVLFEIISVAGGLLATFGRTLVEMVGISEKLVKNAVHSLIESISVTGVQMKRATRILKEILPLIGNFRASTTYVRMITEMVTLIDGATRTFARIVAETVLLGSGVAKNIGKVLIERFLVGDIFKYIKSKSIGIFTLFSLYGLQNEAKRGEVTAALVMRKQDYELTLKNRLMTTIKVIKGDKGYDINFTLKDASGNAYDLTDGTLKFKAQKQGDAALKVDGVMTIVTATEGKCKYTVADEDFDETGQYYAEIEVSFSDGNTVVTWGDITVVVQRELPR